MWPLDGLPRGNPWIFQRIKAYLAEGVHLPEPSVEERIQVALRHLRMKAEYDGEAVAVREMRPPTWPGI